MPRYRFAVALIVGGALTSLAACSSSSPSSPSTTGIPDSGAADALASVSEAGASDASPDAPPPDLSCDTMCAAAMKACSGAADSYPSLDVCKRLCGDLPLGFYGDDGDTLGCRQAHASKAAAGASPSASDCAAASWLGGGVCGTRCDDFCARVTGYCVGTDTVYESRDACDQDCGNRYAFDANAPELTDHGNTLNCRMGAITRALDAADAGDLHTSCQNAGPTSATCM